MDRSPQYSKWRRYLMIGALVIVGIVVAIYLWTQQNQTNSTGTGDLSGDNLAPIGGAGPYAGHSGQMQTDSGQGQASNIFVVPFGSQAGTGSPSTGAVAGTVVVSGPASPGGPTNNTPASAPITTPVSAAPSSASQQAVFVPSAAIASLAARPAISPPVYNSVSPATGVTGVPVTVGSVTVKAPPNVAANSTMTGQPTSTVGAGFQSRPAPAPVYVAQTARASTPAVAYHPPTVAPVAQTPGRISGPPAGVTNFRR